MFKAIVLCASLLLPAVAMATGTPSPTPTGQAVARASKAGGAKSLKGTRSRARGKRQGRSNGAAAKAAKGSSRRARSGRAKTLAVN
jgi:hypothetical protein